MKIRLCFCQWKEVRWFLLIVSFSFILQCSHSMASMKPKKTWASRHLVLSILKPQLFSPQINVSSLWWWMFRKEAFVVKDVFYLREMIDNPDGTLQAITDTFISIRKGSRVHFCSVMIINQNIFFQQQAVPNCLPLSNYLSVWCKTYKYNILN